jgi:predicted RNA polymerase sigma factor
VEEARGELDRAIAMTHNESERRLLSQRADEL